MAFVDIARAHWNPVPDWIEVLAANCDAATQRRAAERIGYSAGLVSNVLRGTYSGNLAAVEEAVRGAWMGNTVSCPAMGTIPSGHLPRLAAQGQELRANEQPPRPDVPGVLPLSPQWKGGGVMAMFLPVDAVLDCYADLTGVPVSVLKSASQGRIISQHRQLAMWVLREMSSQPMTKIGDLLGRRSPATIKEGIERVEKRIAADDHEQRRVTKLLQAIRDILLVADVQPHIPLDVRVVAALGVLTDQAIADADARIAALSILRSGAPEVAHNG